jgi:hypothetical protein
MAGQLPRERRPHRNSSSRSPSEEVPLTVFAGIRIEDWDDLPKPTALVSAHSGGLRLKGCYLFDDQAKIAIVECDI